MEQIEDRLDAHAGQLRALAEVVTALVLSIPPAVALTAATRLEVARHIALEEDEINETPRAESAARDATMEAYAAALLRNGQSPG